MPESIKNVTPQSPRFSNSQAALMALAITLPIAMISLRIEQEHAMNSPAVVTRSINGHVFASWLETNPAAVHFYQTNRGDNLPYYYAPGYVMTSAPSMKGTNAN